jgi:hypothetical protein
MGSYVKDRNRDYDIKYLAAEEQSDGSYIDRHGDIKWYNESGELHREDGPAIIIADGRQWWYLNNKVYLFDHWLIKLNKTDEDKMLLRLCYG